MWVLIDNNSVLIIDSEALELFAVAPEFQLVVEFVVELEALVHLVHGAKAAHADLSHTSQFHGLLGCPAALCQNRFYACRYHVCR